MSSSVNPIVSAGERKYIEDGILEGVRADGRNLLEFRFSRIRCGLVPSANGSARVQTLHGGVDVLAIVKAELSSPEKSSPLYGSIGVGVQYWASAVRDYDGKPANETASYIQNAVESLINTPGCINLAGLCVLPKKYAWYLWVDLVVLGNGGSVLDACGLAAFAALNDTSLPRLRIVPVEPIDDGKPTAPSDGIASMLEEIEAAAADANPGTATAPSPAGSSGSEQHGGARMEYDIELDGDVADGVSLVEAAGVDCMPIPLTLSRVGGRWIADATAEEESIASARVMVGLQAATAAVPGTGTRGSSSEYTVARIETLAPIQGCSSAVPRATVPSYVGERAGASSPGGWQGVMGAKEISAAVAVASRASKEVFRSVRSALESARAGEADPAGDAELTTFGMRLPTTKEVLAGSVGNSVGTGAGAKTVTREELRSAMQEAMTDEK